MIDNVTHKAMRVDMYPVQLEVILRTNLRDRRMLTGWLFEQMVETAKRLWPDFIIEDEEPPLVGFPLPPRRALPERRSTRFAPPWIRRLGRGGYDDDEDDGGI
jgi:hypothetical protein